MKINNFSEFYCRFLLLIFTFLFYSIIVSLYSYDFVENIVILLNETVNFTFTLTRFDDLYTIIFELVGALPLLLVFVFSILQSIFFFKSALFLKEKKLLLFFFTGCFLSIILGLVLLYIIIVNFSNLLLIDIVNFKQQSSIEILIDLKIVFDYLYSFFFDFLVVVCMINHLGIFIFFYKSVSSHKQVFFIQTMLLILLYLFLTGLLKTESFFQFIVLLFLQFIHLEVLMILYLFLND